jgi:hypothetical protein
MLLLPLYWMKGDSLIMYFYRKSYVFCETKICRSFMKTAIKFLPSDVKRQMDGNM